MIVKLIIEGQEVELFQDENIFIDSSVARIKDITKVYTDVSNVFNIPANDVNNKILKYVHKPNVINDIDPRLKLDALITLRGLDYKFGKVLYQRTKLKGGVPSSHEILFVGNLVSLTDALKNNKLSDLIYVTSDSIFDQTYTNAFTRLSNEVNGVSASLFSKKRLVYDSSNTQTETETQTNVYYDASNQNSGVNYEDVIYSIKCIKIIEAINFYLKFWTEGGELSLDFFGKNEFNNLYLMLNNKETETFSEQIAIDTTTDFTVLGNTLLSSSKPTDDTLKLSYQYRADASHDTGFFIVTAYNDGDLIYTKRHELTGAFSYNGTVVNYSSPNYVLSNVTFFVEMDNIKKYSFSIYRLSGTNINTSSRFINFISSVYSVRENVPNIKIIDFLNGLFKMYKLIAIPQNDGSLYVDNIQEYYRKGKVVDLSEWVDVSQIIISYGKVIKEIDYKFSEPQTLLALQFENQNTVSYGDELLEITGDNGEEIDGDTEPYELPFEQVVYERLTDTAGVDDINIQYGLIADESIEPIVIKPHLHFSNLLTLDEPVKIKNDTGGASQLLTANTPSHTLGFDEPNYSTVIGEEFNEFNGQLITGTIYSNHHQAYIEGITGEDKRDYDLSIKNLPLDKLLDLELNDIIKIQDNYFRIDNFKTNIVTGEIKIKLILTGDLDITPTDAITVDRTDITADSTVITADQI